MTERIDLAQPPPVLERRIDLTDMVSYGGATWDWHRLHYDTEYVEEQQLPRPVVDGQMFGVLLAKQVLDHYGPRARVQSMSMRFRAMVYAGDTVRCMARIVSQEVGQSGRYIDLDQEVLVDGVVVVAPAKVRVFIPQDRA